MDTDKINNSSVDSMLFFVLLLPVFIRVNLWLN
jgi:hypothetical protein